LWKKYGTDALYDQLRGKSDHRQCGLTKEALELIFKPNETRKAGNNAAHKGFSHRDMELAIEHLNPDNKDTLSNILGCVREWRI